MATREQNKNQTHKTIQTNNIMKLKFFNTTNLPTLIKGIPQVRIIKAGVFSFNIPATQLLGITENSQIELVQNEEEPEDWFFIVRPAEYEIGFPVRVYKQYKESNTYMFNNSAMAKTFFDSIKAEGKSLGLTISQHPQEVDGVKLFPIITAAAKNNQLKKAA